MQAQHRMHDSLTFGQQSAVPVDDMSAVTVADCQEKVRSF